MRSVTLVAAIGLLSGAGLTDLAAQEDFRALDAGRPLRTTDAYPKKYLEWEVQAGARGAWAESGSDGVAPLALEVGILPNVELGLELEPAVESPEGGDAEWGLEGLGLHGLYNFNRESWTWPALALQAGVEAPVGGALAREEWGFAAGLLATRSIAGGARVHANGGYAFHDPVDGGDFWTAGLGTDVPLGLSSRVLLAGAYAEVPVDRGPTRTWLEAGARLQLSNWTVLDVGIATRLDQWADDRSNVELSIGVSRVFGIRGLTPVPEYPEPAIR